MGNAIVPQLAFEIFKAIQAYELQQQRKQEHNAITEKSKETEANRKYRHQLGAGDRK